MKILHLNEHLAWRGGIETYLLSLMPRLEELGCAQAVAYAEGDASLASEAHHLPELSRFDSGAERRGYDRIKAMLRDEQIDLVHVHNIYNVGAIRAALDHGPTIVTGHDYRYLCPASTFYYRRTKEICPRTCGLGCFATTLTKHCLTPRPKPAIHYYRRVRWFARNAGRLAHVIAPSHAARERFLQAGVAKQQTSVLPYFCPIAPADTPRPLPAEPTMVFMGRFGDNKGLTYFVESLGMLPGEVRGVVVGGSTPEQSEKVQALARSVGCADRIRFQPWASREQITEIMSQASIFVFPSIWAETLGIVGLEALACGVPVVASDVGGVREWLQPGETGLLVPPKDAQAIAGAVTEILNSPELARTMGANGIELVRERFSVDRHVRKLLSIYETSTDNTARADVIGANSAGS